MAMIASIRRMLMMIQGRRITDEELAQISKGYDFRIALAALLVHAGNVSGSFIDAAKDQVRALLVSQLAISPVDASELMVLVNYRNLQWDEVEELVLALSDSLAPQGRALLVEWLWEIVIADRVVTPEESALIAAVATMLGIHKSTQDRIAASYSEARGIMVGAPRAAQILQPAAPQSLPVASDPAPHP